MKSIESRIYEEMGKILQTSLSFGDLNQSASQELFQNGLNLISKNLSQILQEIDSSLEEGLDSNLSLYFMPYQGSPAAEITHEIIGSLPARLPFKIYKTYVTQSEQKNLSQIHHAPSRVRLAFENEALDRNLDLPPAFFIGAALHLFLKKHSSQAEVQVIGGFNPHSHLLNLEQGPVRLHSLETVSNNSLAILSLQSKVGEPISRTVRIDFGRDLEMDRNRRPNRKRLYSTPYFLGEEIYFGIDFRFPILSMDFDLSLLEFTQMKMRIFKPMLGLNISSQRVDQQFLDGVNAKLKEYKLKAMNCDIHLR